MVLPAETATLARQQVAHLNVCEFRIDAGRAATILASMDQAKFDALDNYRNSPAFSEREQAMLDYASELTRTKMVRPETFSQLAEHCSEREICEIVFIVAGEPLNNLTNLGRNVHSDMISDAFKGRRAEVELRGRE